MKCDSCKNQCAIGASHDCPYPQIYCSKGHWEGLGDEGYCEHDAVDLWKNCPDFELLDKREG